jgi:tetratricopeptide (TPR) repeat protein
LGNPSVFFILTLVLALIPSAATARDKKVVIRSIPAGAKVVVVGGGMVCKPLHTEGTLGVTPCAISIDGRAFDPNGAPWMSSRLLGVPLKVDLSKDGYRPAELYLTKKEASIWKGADVAGPIERTFYFVIQEKFEVLLEELPDYPKALSSLLETRPHEALKNVRSRDAIADCKRFYEQNEHRKAIEACNVAIGLSGDRPDPVAYHVRCMSNLFLENVETALADCQEFTRLSPSGDIGWHNTGLIQQRMRKHPDAITSFSKALELNSKNVKALRNRARSYEQQNRIKEALNDCNAALVLTPDDKEILVMQSRLQTKLGKGR